MKTITNNIFPAFAAFALACFALSPQAGAVCQQGCDSSLFNAFLGDDALISNITGTGNTALGWRSLFSNTDASFSTAVGGGALVLNNGTSNTAVGAAALLLNTSGTWNTAAGTDAMVSNDTGSWNNAFGGYALASNVDGAFNNAFGESALSQNVSGMNNTAVGQGALENNDFNGGGAGMANFNTAVGAHALGSNIDGAANTAIGDSAFGDNGSGSNNTVVGWQAGAGVEGNDNIYIGATSGLPGGGSEDGTIRIGDPTFVSACFIAGINGQTASGGVGVFIDGNGKLGTLTSSARFKEAIKPMDKASEAILALRPVTFRYKKEIDPARTPQFGLVAEQVEKVNPDLVARDADGKPYTVRYEAVNAMLLNEFLKEHRQVQEQQKEIDAFRAELREQRDRIRRVSARVELQTAPAQTVVNSKGPSQLTPTLR